MSYGSLIKSHKFDVAKKRIREQNLLPLEDEGLEAVQESAFLFFDHRVTGEEFNERLISIQERFISSNQTHIRFLDEFKTIYEALDAMDKDYVRAIIRALDKSDDSLERVRDVQDGLKKTVDAHQNMLKVLVEWKTKLNERIRCLNKDMDTLFAQVESIRQAVNPEGLAPVSRCKPEIEEGEPAKKTHVRRARGGFLAWLRRVLG